MTTQAFIETRIARKTEPLPINLRPTKKRRTILKGCKIEFSNQPPVKSGVLPPTKYPKTT